MIKHQCGCGRIHTIYEDGEVFTPTPNNINDDYCSNCGRPLPSDFKIEKGRDNFGNWKGYWREDPDESQTS